MGNLTFILLLLIVECLLCVEVGLHHHQEGVDLHQIDGHQLVDEGGHPHRQEGGDLVLPLHIEGHLPYDEGGHHHKCHHLDVEGLLTVCHLLVAGGHHHSHLHLVGEDHHLHHRLGECVEYPRHHHSRRHLSAGVRYQHHDHHHQ